MECLSRQKILWGGFMAVGNKHARDGPVFVSWLVHRRMCADIVVASAFGVSGTVRVAAAMCLTTPLLGWDAVVVHRHPPRRDMLGVGVAGSSSGDALCKMLLR